MSELSVAADPMSSPEADEVGQAPATDEQGLLAQLEIARRHGFFPLVMLLERMLGDASASSSSSSSSSTYSRTDAAPLLDEKVRFRHDPSLSFSASDVTKVGARTLPQDPASFDAPRTLVEVTTTFLGLSGAVTPLPNYLAEEIAQEDPEAPRQREFLDIFHHRLLALFYRTRTRHDAANSYRTDQRDVWSRRLLAVLGIDPELRPEGASAVEAWRLLRLAPLLVERTVTADGLRAAVDDAVAGELGPEARVEVEQFVGRWIPIDASQRSRLGRANTRLGSDLVLGSQIFDCASRFRVVFGPLDARDYARFTVDNHSGGDALAERVARVVRAMVAEPFDFELVLRLAPRAAPALQLTSQPCFGLGRNAWLGGQTREARATHARCAAQEPRAPS